MGLVQPSFNTCQCHSVDIEAGRGPPVEPTAGESDPEPPGPTQMWGGGESPPVSLTPTAMWAGG